MSNQTARQHAHERHMSRLCTCAPKIEPNRTEQNQTPPPEMKQNGTQSNSLFSLSIQEPHPPPVAAPMPFDSHFAATGQKRRVINKPSTRFEVCARFLFHHFFKRLIARPFPATRRRLAAASKRKQARCPPTKVTTKNHPPHYSSITKPNQTKPTNQ